MSGKFVGFSCAALVTAGLLCAAPAGADPDEEQDLLDGSYAQPPRQVWSVSLGDDGLSLRSSSFERDGDTGYFQLAPAADASRPGMFVAVDLSTGARIWSRGQTTRKATWPSRGSPFEVTGLGGARCCG